MNAVVTGYALRTPLGNDARACARALLAGQIAATANPRFPAETYPCQLAAVIPGPPPRTPHDRFLAPMARHALELARQALRMADAAEGAPTGGARTGIFVAMGGLRPDWDDLMIAFCDQQPGARADPWTRGLGRLHPFWMLRHLSNNAHALIAQDLGLRGDGVTLSGGNAGAQSLGAAIAALGDGAIDAALVVAYDSLVEPETIIDAAARGSYCPAGRAGSLVGPYDRGAAGGYPGEAAAAMVLQREGGRTHADGFRLRVADGADGRTGLPAPETIGRVAARVATVGDGVVDGAAIAVPDWDRGERQTLARVLTPHARLMALQAATGQLGAAASAVQAITLATLLRLGELPAIAGLAAPAAGPLVPLVERASTSSKSAVGVAASAPGLAAAVRVSVA